MESSRRWLLYGAGGYTGKLIAELSGKLGDKPILAGRTEASVKVLAASLGLESRIFGLNDPDRIDSGLDGVTAVLHCAGPFSETYRPMVGACLRKGVHYLDITGEIGVFEGLHKLDAQAKKASITLLPGVGFDVVPSDCLAATLSKALPSATELEIAFVGGAGVSKGTLKTLIKNLPSKGMVREGGRLKSVRVGYKSRDIIFSDGRKRRVSSIPWGDVSTAYFSTGIPNITAFGRMPRALATLAPYLAPLLPVLKVGLVQAVLGLVIDKFVRGPSEDARNSARMLLWGRVENQDQSVEATLEIPEGYAFTVSSALASVKEVLKGGTPSGFLTPSRAFGTDFVTVVAPGSKIKIRPS